MNVTVSMNACSKHLRLVSSKKLFLIVMITLLRFVPTYAQNTTVPKIEDLVKIPPSPEAAAFAKYGNTPANLYNGTPNISVPVGTLKGRQLEVPISVSYDASGIKVEQLATSVGLGWNLNVGGMVTRQVNGLPDDFLSTMPAYVPFYHTTINADYEFAKTFTPVVNGIHPQGQLTRYFNFEKKATGGVANEKYEIQPDTYSFHAMGLSGTVFIDYTNNTAYCIESPEIKVIPFFQSVGVAKVITGWEITDVAGNRYTFNQIEKTTVYDNDPLDGQRVYHSAWALSSVLSANDRDVIQFNYNVLPYWDQPQLAGRGVSINDFVAGDICGTDTEMISIAPTYKIMQAELSNISVNGVLMAQFTPSVTSRSDLLGKKSIDKITLFNTSGDITNQFAFRYSYFGVGTNEKEIRLRLDSVQVFGSVLINPQTYRFYYQNGLPSRESMAQDFWGYYSGRDQATTLVPYNYSLDKDNLPQFQGANRTPNAATTTVGSLIKIKYPTGGSTEFTYGPHTLPPESFSYQEEYMVGGASLVGGTSTTDTFNYRICDDLTSLIPKGFQTSIQITQAGTYPLNIILTNTNPNGNPANQMYFIAVYDAGPTNQPRTFCDLLNNGNTLFFQYQNWSIGQNTTQSLTLQPGYYRIMMLNTIPSLTLLAELKGVRTINGTNFSGAGLRIQKMVDKDENNVIASKRYVYFGDLSKVLPSSITESFVASQTGTVAGTLHAKANFEEARLSENLDNQTGNFSECGSYTRRSTNRTQSNYFVTYPVATEIAFDAQGNFNGFTISEFQNNEDSWQVGFSKRFVNNGKLLSRKVYNRSGVILSKEKNFYSQGTVVSGIVGIEFISTRSTMKDTYVKADVATPVDELLTMEYGTLSGGAMSWILTHCTGDGWECITFSDIDYHSPTGNHIGFTCGITYNPNPSHPARIKYNELVLARGSINVNMTHYNTSGIVQVCYKKYTVVSCFNLGNEYQKVQSIYSRYWPRLDSTVSVQYAGTDSLYTYARHLYESTDHFQVTAVRQRDDRGEVRLMRSYYPHEMKNSAPADPIWNSLVNQHRWNEVVKSLSYSKNGTVLLATENTIYKTVGSMILPDKKQFSSGTLPLEDRISFSQYDSYGNIIEISRSNDVKIAVIYGYNNTLPIAQVKNSSVKDIFYTSFEDGPYDFLNDARTGSRSKNGFTKSLSNLTSGNYILSYWLKTSGTWNLVTLPVAVSSTYTISLTGQVDEVRFYPTASQINTITYLPGIGKSSSTDANNLTMFFEYDTDGRLITVRDNDKNVVNTYNYNFIK